MNPFCKISHLQQNLMAERKGDNERDRGCYRKETLPLPLESTPHQWDAHAVIREAAE